MEARAHGNRVTGAENQTADNERADQQQQGAAWRPCSRSKSAVWQVCGWLLKTAVARAGCCT